MARIDVPSAACRGYPQPQPTKPDVGENLAVKNAKSLNPKINLIFKPPNWYGQYQFSGYNLEAQPKVFDMIYAGTETRDTENTVQHLQPYQSYGLMRYFEHIKPGKFGGGWVDPGQRQTLNRFAEQLEDTLFARPKEITIWRWGELLESLLQADGSVKVTSILAKVAGDSYDKLDSRSTWTAPARSACSRTTTTPSSRGPISPVRSATRLWSRRHPPNCSTCGPAPSCMDYVDGATTVFEVLQMPRTYAAYRFE